MSTDRFFGRIKKELKTIDTIITVQEYYNVLQNHGPLLKIGNNFEFVNWKTADTQVVNKPKQ